MSEFYEFGYDEISGKLLMGRLLVVWEVRARGCQKAVHRGKTWRPTDVRRAALKIDIDAADTIRYDSIHQ